MPEINQQNTNKRGRLGRGLGSLLGGDQVETAAANRQGVTILSSQNVVDTQPAQASPTTNPAAPETKKIDEYSQIWKIGIDRIVPNPRQPRKQFLPDQLSDLAASIKEKGVLQPITARRTSENKFEIIAGERRWRAAQMAGLHEVPVILRQAGDQDSLELAIIENIQRSDLNPIEESEAFDRLLNGYGLTQQEIATKVGKERATIANSLRLMLLPLEVKALLRKGEISSGHAKALLSVADPAFQIALAMKIVSEKLSVRSAEKLAARTKVTAPSAPETKDLSLNVSKRLVDSLSEELQRLLGTKVTIDYENSKGKIAIHYYSDDDLTHITEKIRSAWAK